MPTLSRNLLPSTGRPLHALVGILAASLMLAASPPPAGHGAYLGLRASTTATPPRTTASSRSSRAPSRMGMVPRSPRPASPAIPRRPSRSWPPSTGTGRSTTGMAGYGKSTLLVNNYCLTIIGGNTEGCTRCHAGYGFKDKSFDFTKQENVDCLVCHDTTGDYEKVKGGHAQSRRSPGGRGPESGASEPQELRCLPLLRRRRQRHQAWRPGRHHPEGPPDRGRAHVQAGCGHGLRGLPCVRQPTRWVARTT